MAQTREFHTVHRAINKPLTIWGADRRLFFMVCVIGAATFNFFRSLSSGLLMFVVLFTLARLVNKKDPQLLRILLNSARFRVRYDPAKRDLVRPRRTP
jgi:type IV secretory pathway TrbD component